MSPPSGLVLPVACGEKCAACQLANSPLGSNSVENTPDNEKNRKELEQEHNHDGRRLHAPTSDQKPRNRKV